MAEKKQDSFTVTDRRLFTPDGELRQEISEEEISTSKPVAQVAPDAEAGSASAGAPGLDASIPPSPTAAEQKEQADAYRKSSRNWMPASNSAATPPKKWR